MAEVTDGVAFVPTFANVSAIDTDDGLVLVDTGSTFVARQVHGALRSWTTSRLHTAVYSHGHIDHVFGVPVWEEEADESRLAASGGRRPRSPPRPLRPLRDDRRLQRGHQPAAVRARLARMADRVPLPGPHLPRPPRPRRRRSHRAAPPRSRGDRRPHLDLVPRAPGALLRRPVHLGLTQRRQPPEGPALPARVGRRPPPDARPLRRAGGGPEVLLPGHGYPVVGERAGPPGARRHGRRSSTPWSTRRSR